MFLCDDFLPNQNTQVDDLANILRSDCGGKMIEPDEYDEHQIDLEVHWVGNGSRNTVVKSCFVAYGNEASLGELYGQVNLIVKVGKKGSRI